jgi:endonuclease/exonuclease/phosphatase family metal-dependent hydrolase
MSKNYQNIGYWSWSRRWNRQGEFSYFINLQKSGYFWLSETPKTFKRIGRIWAHLKIMSLEKLFILNTHLIIGTVARKESVALIKEKIVLLSAGLPKVIMGDYNAEPESKGVKKMLLTTDSISLLTQSGASKIRLDF